MNKQIEEILKDIRSAEIEYLLAMVTADIDDAIDGAAPRDERLAAALCEKGYRKASSVAREIFEEIERKLIFIRDADTDNIRGVVPIKEITIIKKKYESEECVE